MSGGRFEFDDGGCYCGEWLDGKAHGYGVCTGPNNEGKFEGLWHHGFEVCGVYTWPENHVHKGEWKHGKINGLGTESCNKWTYAGEWKNGLKHGSGIVFSRMAGARYEGTWHYGLQDGYGSEIRADGGMAVTLISLILWEIGIR